MIGALLLADNIPHQLARWWVVYPVFIGLHLSQLMQDFAPLCQSGVFKPVFN